MGTPGTHAENTMPLGEHLDELRRRLIYATLGLLPVLFLSLTFGQTILFFLLKPVLNSLRAQGQAEGMQNTGALEMFSAYFKVALAVTVVVGAPWLLWQAWKFVAPGLYGHERRFAYILAPLSVVMTICSALFLYYIMLPVALTFLIGFSASITERVDSAPLPDNIAVSSVTILADDPADPKPGQMWFNSTLRALRICVAASDAQLPPTPTDEATVPRDAPPPADSDQAKGAAGAAQKGKGGNEKDAGGGVAESGEGVGGVGGGGVVILEAPMGVHQLVRQQYRVKEYVDLFMNLVLAFVAAFQTPVVVLLLGWLDIVRLETLRKYRKHALMVCGVLGAILTPTPDPLSLMMLMLPLYALYELGVLLLRLLPASKLTGPREPADEAAEGP